MSYSRFRFVGTAGLAGLLLAGAVSSRPAMAASKWFSYNSGKHAATLTLVAGSTQALAGFNFDGDGKGKMVVTVPVGTKVTVSFKNASNLPHSAVIVQYSKLKSGGSSPAFPGASTPKPTSGSPKGANVHFSFKASKAGKYAIVCAVPGHEAAGMWDILMVQGNKGSIKV